MSTLLVVGGGPAGVSAAVYALRAGAQVIVLAKDGGALARAKEIDNYYGFPEGISGEELVQRGLKQARRLGARVELSEVLDIEEGEGFSVKTKENAFAADAVVLATGAQRKKPKIEGIDRLEGYGVSYCAVCDGFFYRGKDAAVYGAGEYALHEAQTLLPLCRSVTVLTGGEPSSVNWPQALRVDTRPVAALEGEDALSGVRFSDGELLAVEGLFIAQGTAGGADLARKLGAMLEGGKVTVDENMLTNVPGLYAAGDLTGGVMQVLNAAWQGARAGMAASAYIRSKSQKKREESQT